jgi:hypothetical protein
MADSISIEIVELENGWSVSVFNAEAGTKDLKNVYVKTLEEAFKILPTRIKEVRKQKGED